MNVLLWSPGGSGTHYYGPGSATFRMYRRRDPDRVHISLIHGSDRQGEFPDVFDKQVFLSGLAFNRAFSPTSFLSLLDRYRRRPRFIRQGKRWLKEHFSEFDVFHGMTNRSFTLLPALHAVRLGLPACTRVANLRAELVDESGWRRRLRISERRLALISRLNAVIAISRDIERALLELKVPEEKIVYIPGCVDPSRFRPADSVKERRSFKDKWGLGDDPVIVFVGELTERKGVHLILQALDELNGQRGGWQLVLAGPPNDRAYTRRLETYVNDRGWSEQVHFLGHVADIEQLYRVADIFCLPSQDEGMPSALLEAMVSGAACIVTPFSGAQELIEDGTGGRIVPRTDRDIAGALRDYLFDERLRAAHGAAAHKIALAGYSTEKVLKDHLDLFERLRAGRTPRPD